MTQSLLSSNISICRSNAITLAKLRKQTETSNKNLLFFSNLKIKGQAVAYNKIVCYLCAVAKRLVTYGLRAWKQQW
jgi:hypothetical protein